MFSEGIQEDRSKAEVTFHELRLLFRAVHSGEMEYEIGFLTIEIKQFWISIYIKLVYGKVSCQVERFILTIFYIIQCCYQVLTNKTFRTCY